jgi:AbrB family looped-hinge helix DNA binding protein
MAEGGARPVATTVDRFGRVVIPKKTRDHFGLEPGTPVTISEQEDGILVKPDTLEAPVRLKGRVLVFSGELTGEVSQAVRRHREERIRRLGRGARR